jgi:hypothetical protein
LTCFYVHDPRNPNNDPVLFVPTKQFDNLLEVVNAKLSSYLTIPEGTNSEKFRVKFLDGMPRPRFLGRLYSSEEYKHTTANAPACHSDDSIEKLGNRMRVFFLGKMRLIMKQNFKGNKSVRNRHKRLKNHKEWGQTTKRVQRYLGLRKAGSHPSWERTVAPVLDLNAPMNSKPDMGVLFVSVDLEAWEDNQSIITEVGIGILDTDKLVGVPPGPDGSNWFSLIVAHHFRIKENMWAVNRKWVRGCADQFEFGFGFPLTHFLVFMLTVPQQKRTRFGFRSYSHYSKHHR